MADTQQYKQIPTPEPIFYEALAAAAKCYPDQAKEHYEATTATSDHPVEAFLEEYTGTSA